MLGRADDVERRLLETGEPGAERAHAPGGCRDVRGVEAWAVDPSQRTFDGSRVLDVRTAQEQVETCCEDRRDIRGTLGSGDRAHVERIGHRHALEAELVA